MEVKLRKKTLEERIDQLAMDVAILKVQYQKLFDSLSETKIPKKPDLDSIRHIKEP